MAKRARGGLIHLGHTPLPTSYRTGGARTRGSSIDDARAMFFAFLPSPIPRFIILAGQKPRYRRRTPERMDGGHVRALAKNHRTSTVGGTRRENVELPIRRSRTPYCRCCSAANATTPGAYRVNNNSDGGIIL